MFYIKIKTTFAPMLLEITQESIIPSTNPSCFIPFSFLDIKKKHLLACRCAHQASVF